MDLGIKDKLFIVTGATSGLGNGCARALLNEGAKIIAVARNSQKLDKFHKEYPDQITLLSGDISKSATIKQLVDLVGDKYLDGILVNAGGPPAKSFLETDIFSYLKKFDLFFGIQTEANQAEIMTVDHLSAEWGY